MAGAPALADGSGLPLPRFASLRSEKINVRAGPGTGYPIAWVFVRRGLPVEIVAEYETWRKVRDRDGAEGWLHQSLLSGERSVIVTEGEQALHREPLAAAPVVAQLEPGVVARLLTCKDTWCRLRIDSLRGWIPRDRLWGVYPDERFDD